MASNRSAILLGAAFGAGAFAAGFLLSRGTLPSQERTTYALRDDILIHGNKDLKEIALTFDDGPNPVTARPILDILGRERVNATFFVVGKMVERSPGLVRRMMNEGHEVANHTYSHPQLTGMDASAIRMEIARCGKAVHEATGAHTNLFRPPGMRYDEIVIRTAQDLGYVTVHWNVAAQDFKPRDPARIASAVLGNAQPGSVILLHGHPNTVQALPAIIRELKSRGYRFVRVSQMLGRLPRPVYVKSNAFGVDRDALARMSARASQGIASRGDRNGSRRSVRPMADAALPTPSGFRKDGLDDPAWY